MVDVRGQTGVTRTFAMFKGNAGACDVLIRGANGEFSIPGQSVPLMASWRVNGKSRARMLQRFPIVGTGDEWTEAVP